MKESYEIYVDEDKICTFKSRDSAHQYVQEKHGILMPFLEYEPTGMGNLEVWQNPMIRIEIRRSIKGKIDVPKILGEHIKSTTKNNYTENERKEINTSSAMPCTPRRTRIYIKDKKSNAEEGKVIDIDEEKYIGKKGKDGKIRWAKYYEKNYETIGGVKNVKRQAPKEMAKNFTEGTQKKGENGKMWVVKTQKNGQMRWFKK